MFLFDQNLSYKLATLVESAFPKCRHVRNFQMDTSSDTEIWDCAADNGLTIVTQDADFANRSSIKGHPPKVIHIVVGNSTTGEIAALLLANQQAIEAFIKNTEQSYLLIK